jgi:hypothetical protein
MTKEPLQTYVRPVLEPQPMYALMTGFSFPMGSTSALEPLNDFLETEEQ